MMQRPRLRSADDKKHALSVELKRELSLMFASISRFDTLLHSATSVVSDAGANREVMAVSGLLSSCLESMQARLPSIVISFFEDDVAEVDAKPDDFTAHSPPQTVIDQDEVTHDEQGYIGFTPHREEDFR